MKLATWNVNSIRARHDLVLAWLRRHQPDLLCMQETKVVDDAFPVEELSRLGYELAFAGQKAYNGVAIASRYRLSEVRVGLHDDAPTSDRRLISARAGGLLVVNAYVPNGKSVEHPSFREKLAWLRRLRETLERRTSPEDPVAVVGDFNIARDDRDVWNPEAYRGKLHFHPDEHAALEDLLDWGLTDAFRIHHQEGGAYSWWDYRTHGFTRGQGLRIDYVFLTAPLVARCREASIDAETRGAEKASDHAPVLVTLDG